MIEEDVLEQLVCFTDEEIDNLNGFNTIDKSIFLNEKSNVVDCHKLLPNQQKLSVRKHARFINYPKHKHNYIELMYVYGGKMTHIIDDKEITIHEGELLLLNQNIEHSISYCEENDIIFNFIIKPEFFDFLSSMVDEDNKLFDFLFDSLYSRSYDGEYFVFKVSHIETIKTKIEYIIHNVYRPQFNNELTLKLLVGLLLTELMQYPECIESYTEDTYDRFLHNSILKYIKINYREGSLAVLSNLLHQPDYKICKLVKKSTGKTFKQLIQDERLDNTIKLLKSTKLPINEVMEEVGYENITYFYKIFKERYQMTPHEYRNTLDMQNRIV
ncbi:MAG: AraC family transcriptional regulator [Coprobacillus sp.]